MIVLFQELQDEKSDWDHTLEKIKLLQKLDPDSPVPLEIFDSNTQLIKQGMYVCMISELCIYFYTRFTNTFNPKNFLVPP